MTASLKVHTSIVSAAAIVAVGEVVVSANWKETENQKRGERAVIVPMECLKAPEVPESFRGLVELVLRNTAEKVLKTFCNENPNNYEMLPGMFERPALTESFLSEANGWMTKQQIELAFTASATWKRITSRPEFQTNATYQKAAGMFKDNILKLAAKPTSFEADKCDVILSKLEVSDLDTEFGAFVARRLAAMKARVVVEDVDAMNAL